MNQSPTIKSLSAALVKAQLELKNPHFDSVNPHFKSKFASLGAVRESVVPIFARHGIALSQWPISKEGAAGCRTILACGDEWMAEDFLIPVDKQNAHGYASAVTYAKRIAMQSVAGVVGDDDDDGNQAVGDNVKGEAHGKATPRAGAFESLDIDMQTHVRDIAVNVRTLMGRGDFAGALDEANAYDLEATAKVALWDQFDSRERSALTKERERRTTKEKKAA